MCCVERDADLALSKQAIALAVGTHTQAQVYCVETNSDILH